ncbi:MAG: UDP-glucose--hexose-1-phosphate uridylyltransferase [Elusimicrobiota bacterium]|jgi:UDPglucose--hexose-1-phosphate uridylyltransferase|nr:UDP-glucose--hexose-1-phosphate uridylyltransferase [Elusimicrobiota bacterium]
MPVYKNIEELLAYALKNKLIQPCDVTRARNALFELLNLDGARRAPAHNAPPPQDPSEILADISFYAAQEGLLPMDTATYREIFETAAMAIFTKRPDEVIKNFFDALKKSGAKKATGGFYKYCQKLYYIKTDRVAKNLRWKTATPYGNMDITINLSKPEKDPKEIALHGKMPISDGAYPKCLLCKENEGFAGNLNHPARQNLRLRPLKLNGGKWYFQYSPYVYYNEHCIVLSEQHRPMKITAETFKNLLDFVEMFPHYFLGSNADLPVVGGSILNHDHYQGGRYAFALEKAGSVKNFKIKKFAGVSFDILRWPMSALRLRGNKKSVAAAAARVLAVWQKYDDIAVNIRHATGKTQHNTITPVARFKNGKYEMDLVLRNNRADDKHPWGIFHTRPQRHNIKRENIGLIEVLGMAILPGRLKTEMAQIAALMAKGEQEKMAELSSLAQHYNWVNSFIDNYKGFKPAQAEEILLREMGRTFAASLADCGVFKHDAAGKAAFLRFINKL